MVAATARLVGRLLADGLRALWGGPLSSKAAALGVLAALTVIGGQAAAGLLGPVLLLALLVASFGIMLRGRS